MTSELLAVGSSGWIDEVLTWLVQSTAILAAGLLAGRLLEGRGPAFQSAIHRTTLIAVLACPLASLAIAASGFPGLVIRVPGTAALDKVEVAGRGPDRVGTLARPSPLVEPLWTLKNPPGSAVGASSTVERPSPIGAGASADLSRVRTGPAGIASAASILLAAWLSGTTILGLRLWMGHRRMALLRATALPAGPEVQEMCRELAGRMCLKAPGVFRSPFVTSPCLDGLRRPVILLPEDEDAGRNLRETLVHELAHLGRRDGLWSLLRRLATAAFWVQPLLWVLSRRIEETAEAVCDDCVVASGADRGRYAGHLLELAGRRLPPLAPLGVGMVSMRSLLARRIARILDPAQPLSTHAGRWPLAATWLAGLAGTLLASLLGVGGEGRDLLADEPKPPAAVDPAQGKAPAPDIPITGRIVDREGRPISGVTVRVDSTYKAKDGDLTPWIEAVRRGEPSWVAFQNLDYHKEELSREVETDPQGRFRIEGLGAEKFVTLAIQGPTIVYAHVHVVTRRVEPFPAQGYPDFYGAGTPTIHGADFTLSAAPGRTVEGVVRDAKDGKPLKDVEVRSYGFAGSHIEGAMGLKTLTDAKGRFRLAGFPKGNGNRLLAVPNDDQPYFMQDVAVPDPPGMGAVAVEVGLHRGLWIEGKLTDKATGAPVVGAWLHYLPFRDNPFARATPEFRGGVNTPGFGYQDRYKSKTDGSYRLVGLPGRAIVGAQDWNTPYRRGAGSESIKGIDEHGNFATVSNPVTANRHFPDSMKEIDPAEGTEDVHLDLALDPGAKVRLRVVDPKGVPVTGVKTGGLRTRGRYELDPEDRAEFDVMALSPGEERRVWLVHEGRKLGRAIQVKPGDDRDGPVVVTLEPTATITGRVVDPSGHPVSGAPIRPSLKPGGDYSLILPSIASGIDGRFTVTDVPTGCDYSLGADNPVWTNQWRAAFKEAAVRPGETTDLGDIPLREWPPAEPPKESRP